MVTSPPTAPAYPAPADSPAGAAPAHPTPADGSAGDALACPTFAGGPATALTADPRAPWATARAPGTTAASARPGATSAVGTDPRGAGGAPTPAAALTPPAKDSPDHAAGPEIRRDTAPVAYTAALATMTARNAAIAAGTARELVWLLEHPPVYTAGTSAQPADLIDPRFEIVEAGRGGKYTYHGPGQRIAYVLLDLNTRGRDVRRFVHALEGWVIDTLGDFDVAAWRSATGVGIWTQDIDGREAKIGAIGVRVRRWVTMHGLSVNLAPDLSHFGGIVPCGIAEAGVTSLARIGRPVSTADWDAALLARLDAFLAAIATPCPDPAA